MSKKILIIIAAGLLIILLVLIAVKRMPKTSGQSKSPAQTLVNSEVSFRLEAQKPEIGKGEKINVDVFIDGKGAKDVSGFDIKINYDKTKLKLVSADQGKFFGSYLPVKWDTEKAWFAAVANPASGPPQVQTTSPILTMVLTGASEADSTKIGLTPDSMLVYTTNNLSSSPESNTISVKIK